MKFPKGNGDVYREQQNTFTFASKYVCVLYTPLEVPKLIRPLRHDSQRIFQKGDDDEEPGDGRQVRLQGLRIDIYVVFDLLSQDAKFFERVVWVCCPVSVRRT